MHAFSSEAKRKGKKIGFVPTMGYLHEGHLSLIDIARENADICAASIFVNPAQFAPNEDFSKYPRNEERDIQLLAERGTDLLFLPGASEIYPEGYQTYVDVKEITKGQEGEFRPHHFQGVTTVVSILFNCVMPDTAVFGQKDAQQAAVIKRMVRDLKFNIDIIVAPIVREHDGLAMSSRNVYLSETERKDALVLSRGIKLAADMIAGGVSNAGEIKKEINSLFGSVPSADPDYVRIVDADSFNEAESLKPGGKYYILIACRIGRTRLIDNLLTELPLPSGIDVAV